MKHVRGLLVGVVLLGLSTAAFSQEGWRTINSMNTPRWNFSMVTLANNTVLAVGGQDYYLNALGTCELFDPATGNWSYTGSLTVPRGRGTAVELSDGRVAMIGGEVNPGVTQTDQIEIYDPSTGRWGDGGHLLVARQNERCVYVNDSTIVVIGGLTADGTTTECEIYNAVAQTCHAIASLNQNIQDNMAILLYNGDIMVAGGRDGGAGSNYFSECEQYDFGTNSWTLLPSMLDARMMGVLAQFPDSSILAAGGRNTPNTSDTGSEIFNLGTDEWTTTAAMLQPCSDEASLMLPDSRYLMTGGQIDGYSSNSDVLNVTTPTCEWYDHSGELWYYAPQLNLSRDKHCAVYVQQSVNDTFPTDMVLVAGGLAGSPSEDSLYSFNSYVTPSVEILDVGDNSMEYYMAHQPLALTNPSPVANAYTLNVAYDPKGQPIINIDAANRVNIQLTLTDDRGSQVYRSELNLNSGMSSMDLSQLQLLPGVYFARLIGSNYNKVAKFIVRN